MIGCPTIYHEGVRSNAGEAATIFNGFCLMICLIVSSAADYLKELLFRFGLGCFFDVGVVGG